MKTVYENPWFRVVEDKNFHYLKEDGADNGAVILPVFEEQFVFVRVNRPAHEAIFIEAPRGYGEKNESNAECAVRELFEETGYKIQSSKLVELGKIQPNSAILSSNVSVFLAEISGCENIPIADDEVLEVVYISKKEIKNKIKSGVITDGFTLSALALYWAADYD